MTSTRNKNTPGNYCLEQREYKNAVGYTIFPSFGTSYSTQLPGDGFASARIPWDKMSYNAPDVESFLFGINSTNLVNPAPKFVPELAKLGTLNLYEKGKVIIPEPLVIEKNQRPLPK
jgi:hypothetical protein